MTEEQLKSYLSEKYKLDRLKVIQLSDDLFEVSYMKDYLLDPAYFIDINTGKEVFSEKAVFILTLSENIKIDSDGTIVNVTKPEEFIISQIVDYSESDDVASKYFRFTPETFIKKQLHDNLGYTIHTDKIKNP